MVQKEETAPQTLRGLSSQEEQDQKDGDPHTQKDPLSQRREENPSPGRRAVNCRFGLDNALWHE